MSEQDIEDAAKYVGSFIKAMCEPDGLPVNVVLAGAHAEVVALMVLSLGGTQTAEVLRRSATQIESNPSLSDLSLAMAEPAGQA